MPNFRRCLNCPTLITHGSYCSACKKGTGWGQGRDRKTQADFRAVTLANAGYRCEFMVRPGQRCPEYRITKLVAHHQADGSGRCLCEPHHAEVDNHARVRRA